MLAYILRSQTALGSLLRVKQKLGLLDRVLEDCDVSEDPEARTVVNRCGLMYRQLKPKFCS